MLKVIGLRLLAATPNLLGVIVITFLLTRALPGDPAAFFAGAAATPEAIEEVRKSLGLDRPLVEQFVRYIGELARGDLGISLTTGQPVLQELLTRMPASLELVLSALVLACGVAIPLGVAAATRPNSWVDHVCRVVTTAGVSLPTFFTGLLLAYVFYFLLGWAPSPLGRLDPVLSPPPTLTGLYLVDSLLAGDPALWWASLKQLMLPTLTMAIFVLAPIARMTRASMLSVLGSDFIRTARASGLSTTTVLIRYGLRNALLPVVTTLGMVFGFMLGSSVIIEKVFAWPGVGSYAIDSLTASDYAPIQGFVLTMGVLFVLLNLLVDLLYTLIDPRVSLEG
ncbi:MAG TPA: ABC transporter permease [Burkholderiaceae bacterium]|nr:ABC transporter permease [Burkholderiaceae bacterium]